MLRKLQMLGRCLGAGTAIIMLLVLAVLPAAAQTGRFAAVVTASGQLIVSDTSGAYRWILTNPGEFLAEPIGFTWSPQGNRVAFAVDQGAEISVRVGDLASQSAYEIGRLPAGAISGGAWTADGAGVFAASGDQIVYFDANGGGSAVVVAGGGPVTLISPFADTRPYLAASSSTSPDGRYLFYQTADGRYIVIALDGTSAYPLPGANEAGIRGSGLWADGAPLVAYWGYEPTAILNVTNAATGVTMTLDSGRSAPVPPLTWLPGTQIVAYRDASGMVRAADVSCLVSGCAANPFGAAVDFLPPTAADVQVSNGVAVYRDGTNVVGVPVGCLNSGTCATSGVVIGVNVAPDQPVHAAGSVAAFTASGTASVVDLACVSSGACAPIPIAPEVWTGLVSADGGALITSGGGGLHLYDLRTGTTVYLSEYGSNLLRARWN